MICLFTSLILYLVPQLFSIYVSFISHLFYVFSSFFFYSSCVCSTFVFYLFFICSSIYSSFIFNLFSVCFLPSLYLLFICRHLFYAHSSFLPHLFSIFVFSFTLHFLLHFYTSGHSHLFPRSFATLSWNQIRFVRGQGSIPFCRVIDFPLEISSKPANRCQGETQSFLGKTLHVRLGSEIRELWLSK